MRAILLVILTLVLTSSLAAATVQREALPNGVVLIVDPVHSTPAVCVRVAVRAGPTSEGPLLGSGVSRVLAELLLRVDARESADGEPLLISNGAKAMSFTVESNPEAVGDAIMRLARLLVSTAATEEDLTAVRAMIAGLPENADRVADDVLRSTLLRVHPARLPTRGMENLRDRLSLDLVRRYQSSRCTASNVVVTVVGNVDAASIKLLVAQAFQSYSEGSLALPVVPDEPAIRAPRVGDGEAAGPALRLGWRTGMLDDADLAAWWIGYHALAAKVATVMPSAQVRMWDEPGMPGALSIATRLSDGDSERLLLDTVSAWLQEPPSATALEQARNALRIERWETLAKLTTRAADREKWELAVGDPSVGDLRCGEALALDAVGIQAAFRRAFGRGADRSVSVRVRPSTNGDVVHSVPIALSAVMPQITTFEGGLRAVVRAAPDLGAVHVQLAVGGGASAELADEHGAATLFADIIARRTGTQSVRNPWRSGWSMTTVPDQAVSVLQRLLSALTTPITNDALWEAAVVAAHQPSAEIAAVPRALETVDSIMGVKVSGLESNVGTPDVAVIEAFRRRLIVSGNIVIGITGAVDQAGVVEGLRRAVAITPVPLGEAWTWPALVPAPPPLMSVRYQAGGQAVIALVWPAPGVRETDISTQHAVLTALVRSQVSDFGLQAYQRPHPLRGAWVLVTRCEVGSIEAVIQSVRERLVQVCNELGTGAGLSPEALAQALSAWKLDQARRDQDGPAVVSAWLDRLVAGSSRAESASPTALTSEGWRALAATWLSAEPAMVVVRPPAEEVSP